MESADDTNVSVWINLARGHYAVLASIETSLKKAGLPPLAWYDVLLELERAGDAGTKASELCKSLLLPQYGLSRLLDRIRKDGNITCFQCDNDGRAQVLSITEKGMKLRQRMWLVYGAEIQQAIGQKLSASEAKLLAGLLRKLR